MSIIDDAIVQIQTIALKVAYDSSGNKTIRSAPSKPVESADVLPLAIAYIAEGYFESGDITSARLFYTINVDFHVDRQSMKSAYTQLDIIIPDFSRRLVGDPTLSDTVDTIQYPITFTVGPAMWDRITTQMASFSIPVKILSTPTT
jgi:hypothetical protein